MPLVWRRPRALPAPQLPTSFHPNQRIEISWPHTPYLRSRGAGLQKKNGRGRNAETDGEKGVWKARLFEEFVFSPAHAGHVVGGKMRTAGVPTRSGSAAPSAPGQS